MVVVQCEHFAKRGFFTLQMVTATYFNKKKFEFFKKFMVCLNGQGGRGFESVRTAEVNFSRICADVFYGRTLKKNWFTFTFILRKKY